MINHKERKGHKDEWPQKDTKDGGELTANDAKYANGKEARIEQKQTKNKKDRMINHKERKGHKDEWPQKDTENTKVGAERDRLEARPTLVGPPRSASVRLGPPGTG
jgi:hypothetical protein